MAGRIPIIREKVKISEKPESDKDGGWKKDKWRKVPVKILVGGPDWCGIVAVNLGTAGKPWIKPVTVEKGILDFIQGLLNCVGVGIKEDVKKIEDFFSYKCNLHLRHIYTVLRCKNYWP